ncbi:uncharacterized protein LOC113239380 [Hyposmocoma kahamanoa]|uniref:uncharacterized protein LOC113239380 n=1 Tax=Hyposmocoma kahamanoa TaxID=1477025 RepID=UPI000E6D7F0F|nr:uncharacterized protein LOC113239380 [Hyposmocoma kahamanoa]
MYTSVFLIVSVHSIVALSVHRIAEEPISKSRIELNSLEIKCSLGDILILKAPIILNNNVKYYLYNPRGDFSKLDIKRNKYTPNAMNFPPDYGLSIKNIRKKAPIVTSMRMYNLFNMYNLIVFDDKHEVDLFKRNLLLMGPNEFMLGPLSENDFGNWAISAYYQDDTGEWTEVFQSFALLIIEVVPPAEKLEVVKVGSSFKPMFLYTFPNLNSCELLMPEASITRPNTIILQDLDRCSYLVRNVTIDDQGIWRIIEVLHNDVIVIQEGGTFEPMFPHSISSLSSCELVVPKVAVDRFYTTSPAHADRCGYVVHNVSRHERGQWQIIGIGNIIYETTINLKVIY